MCLSNDGIAMTFVFQLTHIDAGDSGQKPRQLQAQISDFLDSINGMLCKVHKGFHL